LKSKHSDSLSLSLSLCLGFVILLCGQQHGAGRSYRPMLLTAIVKVTAIIIIIIVSSSTIY
jgi:hypothetical protein